MGVEEFLGSLGMEGPKEQMEQRLSWEQILSPSKVAVILGNKGSGKSALAYFLLQYLSRTYTLLPIVVNLPHEKRSLIPENWVIKSLKEIQHTENACVLIDEATTRIPAGSVLENMIKGFSSLARQRSQIIIFIFHASSDVGSRILRGIDVVLLKEPSKRQIEFGSKDNWMRALLEEAKGEFRAIKDASGDPREFTYIDCDDPEFAGIMRNPLCSFWTEDLSKAWSGVDTIGGDLQLGLGVVTPKGIVTRKGNRLVVSPELEGTLPKQEFSTDERLALYGLSADEYELAIEMDRQHNQEELRQMCRDKGLPLSGDKKKLIANLLQKEKNDQQRMDRSA